MNFIKSLIIVILYFILGINVYAVTPSAHSIVNNAVITYSIESIAGNSPSVSDITLNSSVTSITVSNVPAQIIVGTATSNATGSDNLHTSSCLGKKLPEPSFVNKQKFNLPQNITITNASILKSGDPLFIKITDFNSIKNPTIIEFLDVVVKNKFGDSEIISLTETFPSSGVFIGYVQTIKSPVVQNDCQLSVSTNDKITVSYTSNNNNLSSTVIVDPFNTVFDSKTGLPLKGVNITLYNADTGSLAKVLGDDGISIYPSSINTGSTVTDSSGVSYNYGLGEFRFPVVPAGKYKVVVTPISGYSFPSQIDDTTLQQKFSSQYVVVVGASKGKNFEDDDETLRLDIPLDSRSGSLIVTKNVSASVAAIGDFLQYQVTIQNTDKATINNVVFEDFLPKGFRLKNDSFYINDKKIIPQISKGTIIHSSIGSIGSNQTINIKYVTQISVASSLGNVSNKAIAKGDGISSNIGTATVFIKDELMMDKAIIVGTVFETNDCNINTLKRMPNVKIQFETGDYVISDNDGLWHIDSLAPVTHVAKIDKLYIPSGYEPILCENNTAFSGNPNTRFVESTSGNITRVDFYLKRTKQVQDELSIDDLLNNKKDDKNSDVKTNSDKDNIINLKGKSATEALSFNEQFMSHAQPKSQFLFPNEQFNPQVMAIGIAFQAASEHNIKLFVNGSEVAKFNFDGLRQSADQKTNIFYWRGVPIKEGTNLLVAQVFNTNNEKVDEIKKEVYFTNAVTQAIFVPTQSKLVSDGKTPIEVAVRFVDENNHPAHKGLTGSYDIEGPATAYITRTDGLPLDMAGSLRENKTQYTVGDDGIAFIKLMPSNSSGEITLKFPLKDKTAIVRPWISSAKREWILVGIGEGTLAHNSISNHTKSDNKSIESIEDKDGRVALYGKGTIPGDFLLTFAYDNKKKTLAEGPIGQTSNNLTTNELYSVYGDSTITQKDAVSNKKLYIRIEKDQFYAMFGDFQTNLTITDLTRYQRNLTGLKSEYKNDKFSYNAFAAKSATLLQKEEISSDGTTGLYHSKSIIEPNTEIISIVTRNRNQRDVIIQTKTLNRYIDYDIDYDLGTIRLKESVPTYDLYFNPNFIRIEYNTIDNNGEHTIVGGRIAYKPNPNTEIGLTQIRDNGQGTKDSVTGIDVQYNKDNLKIKAEVAINSNKDLDTSSNNKAYNIEAQYLGSWGSIKGYTKKVDDKFGLNSALPSDIGIKKTGVETIIKLQNDFNLISQAIMQKDLTNNSTDKLIDTKIEKKINENFTAYAGVKVEQINNPTGKISDSLASFNGITNVPSPISPIANGETNILYSIGGQYKFSTIPLRLTSQLEFNPHNSDAVPSRLKLAAEYDINDKISLVVDNEYDKYASASVNINRIGVKTKPWDGARIQGYVGNAAGSDSNQFYQLAFDQSIKWNKWNFDAGVSRQNWNHRSDLAKTPAGTLLGYENYTVYQLGAIYRNDPFIFQSKIENRIGSDESKFHIKNDIYKKLSGGFAVSFGQDYQTTSQGESSTKTIDIKGGLSYRDPRNINTILTQVNYIVNNQNNVGTQNSTKFIVNTHYDYKPNYNWELMNHVGYKFVKNTFDDNDYKGSSYVASSGIRNYFSPKWDWSAQAMYAATPSVGVVSKGLSASLGYNVFKDAWVSVGYQKITNYDRNFNFDESYVKGVFIKFRFKFDEESFHLNK